MRRAAVLAALLVVLLAAARADGVAVRFRFGVAAGEIRADSAILWTRAPRAGAVQLQLSSSRDFQSGVRRVSLQALPANDLTVQAQVARLSAGRRYWYRFLQTGVKSPVGSFETAPAGGTDARVRFAFSGGADATPKANGQPGFGHFEVYGRMAGEGNDFNVNLGDTVYSDSAVPGSRPARTLPAKWERYRLGLALHDLRRLRAATGLYSEWGDREFASRFTRPEDGEALYAAGAKAFRDYSPVAYSAALGLYRSVRWGKNLELFFLDERSFRSAEAAKACSNDLAPTAPQSVRTALASVAPALATPIGQACLAALDDPARTILGAAQYAAFTEAIQASTATFKVVLSEAPIEQLYVAPYDRWEGYAAERDRLLRFLQASVRNVVFLSAGAHATLVGDVRYQTLGGPVASTGMWEVAAGPVAAPTFSAELDALVHRKGAGALVGSSFLEPPPPAGLGLRCAALDTPSYAEVTVTSRTLTVAPKDAQGRPVRDAAGAPCAPLVLQAQ